MTSFARTFALLFFCLIPSIFAADEPKLPRVLILGDSISMGYTEPVRKQLKGVAEVRRPAENCQHSGYALARIQTWLGDEKWDVIHFNWGIWDTHMLGNGSSIVRDEAAYQGPMRIRHTPEQYRENLTQLLETLQKTGAKLVWASTTPILKRTGKRFEDIPSLNAVAAQLMRERGIPINDLYAFTLPNANEWQNADQVHFNAAGNQQLGERVARAVRDALANQNAPGDRALQAPPRNAPDFNAAYHQLLALFPENAPGKGADRGKPEIVADQPMTYGLVLSSEALRFRKAPSEEGTLRIQRAAGWLLENSHLAADGKIGWGLPFEWNEHPANTSYTITTAVVMEGLLDALSLGAFWSPAERLRMLTALREVQTRWCTELWVEGHGGGYFRYDTDDKGEGWFCVNAPAMFLGGMARFFKEHSGALSAQERVLFKERMEAQARAIVASVKPRENLPFWEYIVPPNKFKSLRPNDLVHQAYILWGMEHYRDGAGAVPIPWSRAQSLESLARFWKEDSLRFFAQDEPQIKVSNREAPSNLWGIGMYLAILGKWGAEDSVARCFHSMIETHGPFPALRVLPATVSADANFYLRDGAHVLFGLAHAAFQ